MTAPVDVDFARASAVVPAPAPVTGHPDGHAVYDIAIDPGWVIGDKPNGGYLLATMGRAAVAAAATVEGPDHPHPVAASATYVSSPTPGPARVEVEVLRRGRRMSQARARLRPRRRPVRRGHVHARPARPRHRAVVERRPAPGDPSARRLHRGVG